MGLKEKWGWVIFVMMMVVVLGFGVNVCWGCLEKEKAALLNLKAVLKFGEPEYLASWKEDEKSDCCEGWEGVGCGHNKRVQSLSVVGNYFGGSQVHFNASILLPLQDLRALYLSWNGISKWIESKGSTNLRSSLRKLERLDLKGNCLGSSIIQQLSGFHSLRNLSLSATCITGHVGLKDIDAISMNLKELDLSYNDMAAFTTEHNETMKLATRLTKLKLLDLRWNNNLGNNFLSIGSAFASLKYLTLAQTGLIGQIHLHDIEAMENLEALDLSENSITGFVNYNETMKLATRLTKLELLDLSANYELGNNFLSIGSAFASLKYLKLAQTGLIGQIHLHDIEAMENLEELYLSDNNITGFVDYNETMQLATRLTKLKLLDLTGNYNLGNIPSIVSALPSLKHLILANTGLTGQIQLHEIEAMKNLEELDLSDNSITGFVNYNRIALQVNCPQVTQMISKLRMWEMMTRGWTWRPSL